MKKELTYETCQPGTTDLSEHRRTNFNDERSILQKELKKLGLRYKNETN